MAGSDLGCVLLAAALATAAMAAAGCRGATPEPVTRDEAPASTASVAPTPPAAAPPPREVKPSRDDQPIVVDPGEDGEPASLVETARAERERRAGAGRPVAVITDKTLPDYARKGQITIADPQKKRQEPAAAEPVSVEPVKDEQYWRGRGRDIRERWSQAFDDVKELEQRSAELRQKFYLESDTFTRDNQIKPEWDRVLERLRQARLDVEAAKNELAEFLEEGRAAGVMAGWLREGEEEEPEELTGKKEAAPSVQAVEPRVVEPPPAAEPPFHGDWR